VRRVGLGLIVLGLSATSWPALADTPPSAWDRARDPAVVERYRLHKEVQAWMNLPREGQERGMRLGTLERARAALEEASAATSPDVRLRFDLGEIYENLDRHEEALAVLEPALAMAPDHSAAPRAWLSLAFAAAKLDRSREEIRGYDAFLARSTEPDASVLANRAEAEMRLGDLDAAVAGYREVIDGLEHGRFVGQDAYMQLALARWGLAVALDRSGDRGAAESEARTAVESDPREAFIGDQENVFFVPAYERDWYYGLGRAERAKLATDAARAVAMWDLTVQTWADYIQKAASTDRWLPLARAHLASAKAARAAAVLRLPATRRGLRRASSSPFGER
jgi:tetratricopeptide (TPR) repeat protein